MKIHFSMSLFVILFSNYYYLDYYFPELHLAVELDSDLHNPEKDNLRDLYLQKLGITVFRIQDLQKPNIQKSRFKELTALMRSIGKRSPIQFDFCKDIFHHTITSQKP